MDASPANGWIKLDGETNKCVYVAESRETWNEAFDFCQSIQGRLPSLDEAADFVNVIINDFHIHRIMSTKHFNRRYT